MEKGEEKKYENWIRVLADYQGGRPNFSDQTVGSLVLLKKLVHLYEPQTIMELGTAHGLSTRLWLEEAPSAKIVCVDASFDPLKGTASVLPLDLGRLELKQGWVHDFRLQDYWEGRALLYVDIHIVKDAVSPQGKGEAPDFKKIFSFRFCHHCAPVGPDRAWIMVSIFFAISSSKRSGRYSPLETWDRL